MDMSTVTALMVAPSMRPCTIELYNDVGFILSAVGIGLSGPCSPAVLKLSGSAAVIYNEDAPIHMAKGNRRIGNRILAGVFYIVGIENGRLASLSRSDMERYKSRFWEPEIYSNEEVCDNYLDSMAAGIGL